LRKTLTNGIYKVEVRYYPKGWGFSRALVYKDERLIADIRRDYLSFWMEWIIGHPNGNDYLLCSEKYHGGVTLLNLTTEQKKTYDPGKKSRQEFFIWVSVKWDGDRTLLVEGCYWADVYEMRAYDFADPEQLPYPLNSAVVFDDEEKDEYLASTGL
jgi:hypothetical protein